MADITSYKIEVVQSPQNVGSLGAAAVAGVGIGVIPNLENIKEYVEIEGIFTPDSKTKAIYERNFQVFKEIYKYNKKGFKALHTDIEVLKDELPVLN